MLSGQHISAAMALLHRRRLAEGLESMPFLCTVDAEILKYETPVHVRQLYAGERQFQQQSVGATSWSNLLFLALPSPQREANDHARLVDAVARAGFERETNRVCTGCLATGRRRRHRTTPPN